ncbi:MAG: NADH-quinone oxidoreductase subunit J [Chloroflexaceae bacterium]|nr:NADH-quinone oxidoreductase subunit J [Chloroflexaceae bacterium]
MDLVVQIMFGVTGLLILGAAFMVVSVRNIIHAALWLITCFFGIAMLYLLLQAEFLAIVQILLYIGAVAVLVLFAVMLTRQIDDPDEPVLFQRWRSTLLITAILFAAVLVPTIYNHNWLIFADPQPAFAGPRELGFAFMNAYLLPFQIAAVLLLAALVGAIIIAMEDQEQRRVRVLTLAEEVALRGEREPSPPTRPANPQPASSSSNPTPPPAPEQAGEGA